MVLCLTARPSSPSAWSISTVDNDMNDDDDDEMDDDELADMVARAIAAINANLLDALRVAEPQMED